MDGEGECSVTLSKNTIKALNGLRATHWEQLRHLIELADREGSYYGHRGHYRARQSDLDTVALMAYVDLTEGRRDD